MFRVRQVFRSAPSCAIMVREEKVLESGVVESTLVNFCDKVLPPVENYDLEALLKAGVNLKQVRCNLIPSKSAPIPPEVLEEKKETKTEPANKEN